MAQQGRGAACACAQKASSAEGACRTCAARPAARGRAARTGPRYCCTPGSPPPTQLCSPGPGGPPRCCCAAGGGGCAAPAHDAAAAHQGQPHRAGGRLVLHRRRGVGQRRLDTHLLRAGVHQPGAQATGCHAVSWACGMVVRAGMEDGRAGGSRQAAGRRAAVLRRRAMPGGAVLCSCVQQQGPGMAWSWHMDGAQLQVAVCWHAHARTPGLAAGALRAGAQRGCRGPRVGRALTAGALRGAARRCILRWIPRCGAARWASAPLCRARCPSRCAWECSFNGGCLASASSCG